MMQHASNDERQTKNEKRSAARDKARQLRESQQKQAKRRKLLLQSSVALGAIAVFAVIALVIVTSGRGGPSFYPANMASDGVVMEGAEGSITVRSTPTLERDAEPIPTADVGQAGVPHVQVFVDYHCPHCGEFENFFGDTIQEWVADGEITLETFPVAILNSGNYSARAANAAACVVNYAPSNFLVFHHSLFDPQPQQAGGIDNEQLQQRAHAAGVNSTAVDECISSQAFRGWVSDATRRAVDNPALWNERGGFGTPTVLINGERLVNLGDFVTAVQLAQSEMMGEEAPAEEDAS